MFANYCFCHHCQVSFGLRVMNAFILRFLLFSRHKLSWGKCCGGENSFSLYQHQASIWRIFLSCSQCLSSPLLRFHLMILFYFYIIFSHEWLDRINRFDHTFFSRREWLSLNIDDLWGGGCSPGDVLTLLIHICHVSRQWPHHNCVTEYTRIRVSPQIYKVYLLQII